MCEYCEGGRSLIEGDEEGEGRTLYETMGSRMLPEGGAQ